MQQRTETGVPNPWTRSPEEVLRDMEVSPEEGLSGRQHRERKKRYGKNRLEKAEQRSGWSILIDQFKNLIIGLLAVAAAVSFVFSNNLDGAAIVIVIGLTVAIGFFTEYKAVRSMEALRRLSRVKSRVRRDGKKREVPAEDLVPGDIVLIERGDVVTADIRILQASKLQVNESALTGESVPVGKTAEKLDKEEIPLAERRCMLFKGTAVSRGSGEGVVTATGMQTELGRISSMVEKAEEETTPLEKRLTRLAYRLIWVTLAITGGIALIGIVRGREVFLMVETAIALAVAAVPEGLPVVTMVALARGMAVMARRNAVVNRLASVETLGATNVIFIDKTGTLTENRMTVRKLVTGQGEAEVTGEGYELEGRFKKEGREIDPREEGTLFEALKIGVLCNNGTLPGEGKETDGAGDPMEVALLVAGEKAGIDPEEIRRSHPREKEEPFDPETKKMATFHKGENGYLLAVKGAPEAVLKISAHVLTEDGQKEMGEDEKGRWSEANSRMAEEGLRVLALAEKKPDSADADPYRDLVFLGLVGLLDPPREGVREAVRSCRNAGIRVVMVTGDHAMTARKIAQSVGLVDEEDAEALEGAKIKREEDLSDKDRNRLREVTVFARVDPKQKLDLISVHQDHGSVVAMTGDGVNDAPALNKADIGIAMGQRGTEVAREASDMILQDDAFSTIVAAVEHGRIIFDNIRKFVVFLLSGNVGEVLAVAGASLYGAPLPLLPLQILFLNLLLDVFPALALGLSPGSPEIMDLPPRDPSEPVLTRNLWIAVTGYGLVIASCVLGSLALAKGWLGLEGDQAVTISFLTLAFARLWHVFNMRKPESGIFRNEVTENGYVWSALALCAALILAAVFVPGLSDVLSLSAPSTSGWLVIFCMSLGPIFIGQAALLWVAKKDGSPQPVQARE